SPACSLSSTLSLHDALPIWLRVALELDDHAHAGAVRLVAEVRDAVELAIADHFGDALEQHRLVDLVRQLGDHNLVAIAAIGLLRSEEHTSELQSRENLVCRL